MLADFDEYIRLIQDYDIHVTSSHLIGDSDAVQCITAHKAKWLEYSHVYAIGLTEKQYKRGKNSGNPLHPISHLPQNAIMMRISDAWSIR